MVLAVTVPGDATEWSPEINPHTHGQLIFDKTPQKCDGEEESFPQKVLEKSDSHVQKNDPGASLITHTTVNPQAEKS